MSTWKPENERDTAYYIFNELFMCRVSYIQSVSVDYIKKFGMPSSGHASYDRETANELVTRMLSINQMVEFYKEGVNIYVVNPPDTKRIYEFITAHLLVWKKRIEEVFHTRDAPLEDLLLLDKFANTVYAHAVSHFNKDIVDSILARSMSNVLKTTRTNVLAPLKSKIINPITETVEEDTGVTYPERSSMADAFAKSRPSTGINGRWK